MKFQVDDVVLDSSHSSEAVVVVSVNSGDINYPIQTSVGRTYTLEGRYHASDPITLTLIERPNKEYKIEQITSTSKLITFANGTQIYDNGNYVLLLPTKGILE